MPHLPPLLLSPLRLRLRLILLLLLSCLLFFALFSRLLSLLSLISAFLSLLSSPVSDLLCSGRRQSAAHLFKFSRPSTGKPREGAGELTACNAALLDGSLRTFLPCRSKDPRSPMSPEIVLIVFRLHAGLFRTRAKAGLIHALAGRWRVTWCPSGKKRTLTNINGITAFPCVFHCLSVPYNGAPFTTVAAPTWGRARVAVGETAISLTPPLHPH